MKKHLPLPVTASMTVSQSNVHILLVVEDGVSDESDLHPIVLLKDKLACSCSLSDCHSANTS